MKNKQHKFLNYPEYDGGTEAFRKYIKENLVYPEEAVEKRVEGAVLLTADVDDNGNVSNVTVKKGIGSGCDEEAIRLVKNAPYRKVKNRGVRVKTQKRFKINFKLPPQKPNQQKTVSYNFVPKQKTGNKTEKTTSQGVYSYNIKLNK